MLNKGSAGTKGLGEEAVKMGTILGDVVVKKGSEAEEIFMNLAAQSNAFKLSLAPMVLEFAKSMNDIIGIIKGYQNTLMRVGLQNYFSWDSS